MSKAWSHSHHLYSEAKLKVFSLQTWPGFYFTEYQRTPLPNQPVFLWHCLQTGQGRLPQWGRMPLSERSWRAQMQWSAGASKLAASAVWMQCYLDTWKVGLLLLWEEHLSCFSFSSRWEKGVISLCWRVFQPRYCLYCWETVFVVQTCIMVRNYLLTRSLSSLFSVFVPGSPLSACTNQVIVYFDQGVQFIPPGKA